ncbi:MAG: heavy metal-associated domain-containing protein [Bdellovibrionota bacterium]|nr:heavy metal-associated domain-containing protein [Bdellovibrionota bacterium]
MNFRRLMSIKNYRLKVKGMMCMGCENRVKNALENIDGISNVKANHKDGTVEFDTQDDTLINVIKETINDLGFKVL